VSNRRYPYYAGCESYRGNGYCDCCPERATYVVDIQFSWFRGDDESYKVCGTHLATARTNFTAFGEFFEQRKAFLSQRVEARHEETGRAWSGERRNLPPRYQVIADQTNQS
jgi:hypothetical protein